MSFDAFLTLLSENNIRFSENEPLSKHTSFKIGGNARVAAFPDSEPKLVAALRAAKDAGLRSVLLGNGSNVLVSDRGFDGVVIFTTDCKEISRDGNVITAKGAGCALEFGFAIVAAARGEKASENVAVAMQTK